MDNQPIQPPPPSSNNPSKTLLLILGTILLMAISGVGGYFLGARNNQTAVQNQQPLTASPTPLSDGLKTPSPTESSPTKTLIKPTTPGKYTNEQNGYTVEFPEDWKLYERFGHYILYHPKCNGEDLILPEKKQICTSLSLPDYSGGTGWGYGNKRQTKDIVTLTNNVTATKEMFYYDTNILISWIFNVDIPKEERDLGISALVAFANVNEDFTPGSLETVNTIIKSLNFKK